MKNYLQEAEQYVIDLFTNKLDAKFVYHSIAHTQRVVEKVQELTTSEIFLEEDKKVLILAAWFHDTGYVMDPLNHEKESNIIVAEFLTKHKATDLIDKVTGLITSTKMGVKPVTLLEKILKDADTSHLGSKNYTDFCELLRKEWQLVKGKTYKDSEWNTLNIDFLTNHNFYSTQAVKLWEKQKSKNIAQLLKKEQKKGEEKAKLKHKKEELALKKNKVTLPERGVETMFRVALRNHITLSDIADTKANILLSVNAIIISMTLSTLIPKLDNPSNHYLIIPTLVFVFFTIISIVLSVLATRPNVTEGKFTKEDVAAKKVNLIFFGNFHKMKLSEFEWAMDEMLKDRDYLYGSLTKDLYFLGLVLNRKYKLLRITYGVFLIGIIVSVLAFGIAFQAQETAKELLEKTAMFVN